MGVRAKSKIEGAGDWEGPNFGPLFPEISERRLKDLVKKHRCGWQSCRMRFLNWERDCQDFLARLSTHMPLPLPCPWLFCRMLAGVKING